MSRVGATSGIDLTARKLRQLALGVENGALLGSEQDLTTELGTSRETLRQAARLLEREGVLKVRRGLKGGYFAARPGINSIQHAIRACIETFDMNPDTLSIVDAAIWEEAVHKLATARPESTHALAERFQNKLIELPDHASPQGIIEFEREWRLAVFDVINSSYLRFLFDVNVECFRAKPFWYSLKVEDTRECQLLMRSWRLGKQMELKGIVTGDWVLVMTAVGYLRDFWRQLGTRADVVSILSEHG